MSHEGRQAFIRENLPMLVTLHMLRMRKVLKGAGAKNWGGIYNAHTGSRYSLQIFNKKHGHVVVTLDEYLNYSRTNRVARARSTTLQAAIDRITYDLIKE